MHGDSHGATYRTFVPMRHHWHPIGGGTLGYGPHQDPHLREPPGGDGILGDELSTRPTSPWKTLDAHAQSTSGLGSRDHHGLESQMPHLVSAIGCGTIL